MTQNDWKEEENYGTCKVKVQGEDNCPALTYYPNYICTCKSNPYPHNLSNASSQMPIVKSMATSIPVTVYNLAQGNFEGIPYPAGRPQVEENPSATNCNPPQPEAAPNAPSFQVREDTPWPNTVPASMNLSEARADWPIPLCQHPLWK